MSVPRLISISGSVHSGKTTVARMIAAKMPNAAYVDGDLISSWVGLNYPDAATIDDMLPEVHKKLIEIIRSWMRSELDIIIDYPFDDKTRQLIVDSLSDLSVIYKWYLLKPDIEKVLAGSETRPELSEWEIGRIKYHYSGDLVKTNMATVIDSTHQSPEETVKEIMEEL